MKIFTKLLITLLCLITLLFASLYSLLQWSFDQGMLDYINQREVQGLGLLSDNLIKVHNHIGDLSQLKENPRWWHDLVRASSQGMRLNDNDIEQLLSVSSSSSQGKRAKRHRPPHLFDESPPHLKKKPLTSKGPRRAFNDNHQSKRPHQNKRPHESEQGNKHFDNKRIPSLVTLEKTRLFGRYTQDFSLKTINNNGEIIGYLALPPTNKLTERFDLAFSQRQQKTWLIILLTAFLLTLLVAVVLSKYFVKRLQTVTQATNKLIQGEYQITLSPSGKDELATLARNFNDLARTLAQNDKSRKAWLADISHELRTPLAIVKGEIEALQDGIREVTPLSLQSLADEITHLQKLINDLNQLSNADIGALNYQKNTINLTKLLTQNIQRHQTIAEQKGIKITLACPTKSLNVWADETRLNQLIDNLLTNSFKYTDAPGKLTITLTKAAKYAYLSFEDSAPGVPDNSITQLFEHLFRVENSRNRKTGGSGLGLALCKKIIEAHHGEISAYHSPIGGLGIKITLPRLYSTAHLGILF